MVSNAQKASMEYGDFFELRRLEEELETKLSEIKTIREDIVKLKTKLGRK